MLLAGGLGEFLLTVFESITGQQILQTIFADWQNLVGLVVFSLVAGLLAGIYPALYLTRFQPIKILKGNLLVTCYIIR